MMLIQNICRSKYLLLVTTTSIFIKVCLEIVFSQPLVIILSVLYSVFPRAEEITIVIKGMVDPQVMQNLTPPSY